MPDTIEHTLGRIEGKIDALFERVERQSAGIYGPSGIESRLRALEQDCVVMKTKAGFLSAIISTIIVTLGWLIPWIFRK